LDSHSVRLLNHQRKPLSNRQGSDQQIQHQRHQPNELKLAQQARKEL